MILYGANRLLTVFRATMHDVEAIFGRLHNFAARSDRFIWYHAIQVNIRSRTIAAAAIDWRSSSRPRDPFVRKI